MSGALSRKPYPPTSIPLGSVPRAEPRLGERGAEYGSIRTPEKAGTGGDTPAGRRALPGHSPAPSAGWSPSARCLGSGERGGHQVSTDIGVQEVLAGFQRQPALEQEIDEVTVLGRDFLPSGPGWVIRDIKPAVIDISWRRVTLRLRRDSWLSRALAASHAERLVDVGDQAMGDGNPDQGG